MEERRRLSLEEIDERHPRLLAALREHPHIGFVLVRSSGHGPTVLGAHGTRYLAEDRVEGEDPLRPFSGAHAPDHLRRDGHIRARARRTRQQLLRPRARAGLRVRGADLVPRWPRRTADAAVHPASRRSCRVPARRIVGAAGGARAARRAGAGRSRATPPAAGDRDDRIGTAIKLTGTLPRTQVPRPATSSRSSCPPTAVNPVAHVGGRCRRATGRVETRAGVADIERELSPICQSGVRRRVRRQRAWRCSGSPPGSRNTRRPRRRPRSARRPKVCE